MTYKKPTIIEGNSIFDNRGSLTFVNKFNLKKIKRFYIIKNHNAKFIRAWHGHRIEEKFFFCIEGAFQLSCVKIDNFKKPNPKSKVFSWVLSSEKPQIIFIPKGYANGTMTLSKNTKILVFSSSSLEESKSDDYRYSWDHRNPWDILAR